MKTLLNTLKDRLVAKQPTVLVTVVASSGSTPRGTGARMLVGEEGRIIGTIGGGAVEYRSTQMAVKALFEKSSYTNAFTLTKDDVANLGMICGGAVTVFFQYIGTEREDIFQVVKTACEMCENDEDAWLVIETTDESDWGMGVYSRSMGLVGLQNPPNGLTGMLNAPLVKAEMEGRRFYAEQFVTAGRAIIFGCGHVAQELAPVLSHLGFRVVALDDRPQFASKELFPTVEQVGLVDFSCIADTIQINENDYVCIMTRGHAYDTEVQKQVLRTKAYYIGVMGSIHKKAAVEKLLLEDGIPQQDIDRVCMPIGMAIKAQTPAEIAISIAGEMIQKRAERNGL
ncbi:MAG: XdhC family protein [Christensenellales bacterium]|jgi:xanthine dehydrogenase accessory factor